jgi:hypothetical protein
VDSTVNERGSESGSETLDNIDEFVMSGDVRDVVQAHGTHIAPALGKRRNRLVWLLADR